MATLVLTAVGTALGGPLGGAIGSLIGQSIDQQVLGPNARGPRLGDLSVQSSTYGTQIPRIYGTMRVAGSVIWATDLKESTAQTGAKGQPDTTVYSYSVSFAVALSSRPLSSVGRIWADGKLLRGASGDFKVSTGFRFYAGGEDQVIDPLIASIEGISSTPAYRGSAIAVFEDLELAEFGNRIPFLTFETVADEGAVELGSILADASAGVIECTSAEVVGGYAAYGASIRAAVRPLTETWGVDLVDDGRVLRAAPLGPSLVIGRDELGCGTTSSTAPVMERSQTAAAALPSELTLSYYEPERDFQAGQMRAQTGDRAGRREEFELPVALSADSAKGLAQGRLARAWARRDSLVLRLPPPRMGVEPGALLDLDAAPRHWIVERSTIEGMVTVVELRAAFSKAFAVPAAAGRALVASDIAFGPTELAIFEVPDPTMAADASPAVLIAASSAAAKWRSVPVEATIGGVLSYASTAAAKSMLGHAVTLLPPGDALHFDESHSFEVQLVDTAQVLESCDDGDLVQGFNLAVLGNELLQFGRADLLGDGLFRLSRLVRGRRATESAMHGHVIGEPFAMLKTGTLTRMPLLRSASGSVLELRPRGLADTGAKPVSAPIRGDSLRPPSPVHLHADWGADGSLRIAWIRRSRLGFEWLDDLDAPLGETSENYRVIIETADGRVERQSTEPFLTVPAADLSALGPGDALIAVQQIGDLAASKPATLTFRLA